MALALRQAFLPLSLFKGWAPWSIPSLQSLLDLFPPFLLAVPKSKVSHSRKAMRSANKGLKDKQSTYPTISHLYKHYPLTKTLDITNCAGCGSVKLAHHICPQCYSSITRRWKAKNREESGEIPDLSWRIDTIVYNSVSTGNQLVILVMERLCM